MSYRGMKEVKARRKTRLDALLRADIQAHAFCRLTRQQIAEERRRPGPMPPGWNPVQPSLLRQADDQTVVSLAAVRGALGRLDDREPARFDLWGILAASRFLGRSGLVQAIAGFRSEGVWSISPHLSPHATLHSPAGTLSLAMGIHGPNLGIGGGPGSGFEGFLTALTWLSSRAVPGVWLVFSGWSPEFVPDQRGEPREDCECHALALVLVPSHSVGSGRAGLALVESRTPEHGPPPDFPQLDVLLARSSYALSGSGYAIAPGILAHDAHMNSGIPRPHFAASASSRIRPHVIATDASGRLKIELFMPKSHRVKEDQ